MLGVQGVCIPRGGLCSFEYRGMVGGGQGVLEVSFIELEFCGRGTFHGFP